MAPLSRLAINEEGFVFDPTTGDSFHASSTGLFILHALQSGQGRDAIARRLVEEFEVAAEDAARDVADFCGQLRLLGLND